MVNLKQLLTKLEDFGIIGDAISWISSYLKDQGQAVETPYLESKSFWIIPKFWVEKTNACFGIF